MLLLSAEGASGRIRLCRADDAGQEEVVRVSPDHSPGGAGEGVLVLPLGLWAGGCVAAGDIPAVSLQRREEEVGTDGVGKGAVGSAWLPRGPQGRSKAPHTPAGAGRQG